MQLPKRLALDLKIKVELVLETPARLQSGVRSNGEHAFHLVKNLFRGRKVFCKGLAKNEANCPACSAWPVS